MIERGEVGADVIVRSMAFGEGFNVIPWSGQRGSQRAECGAIPHKTDALVRDCRAANSPAMKSGIAVIAISTCSRF